MGSKGCKERRLVDDNHDYIPGLGREEIDADSGVEAGDADSGHGDVLKAAAADLSGLKNATSEAFASSNSPFEFLNCHTRLPYPHYLR